MPTVVISLPNGIQQSDGAWTKEVELDEMTGFEEDILADMRRDPKRKGKLLKSGNARMTAVLARCTVRIGSEKRPADSKRFAHVTDFFEKHWGEAYLADRAFALIRLRQLSLGSNYAFPATCPSCGFEHKKLIVDLSTLVVNEITLEVAQKEHHQITLPSGTNVAWRFLKGKDGDLIDDMKKQNPSAFMTAMLFMKLVKVNGESPTFELLQRWKSSDRNFFLQALDGAEGGIENRVKNTCANPDCGEEFETSIDAGSRSFFFPSATS